MSFLDAKPTDSKDSLLSDIVSAAVSQRHAPGLPLRPFAALMIKVGDETAVTVADLKGHITRLNDENAKLQWWVVALALAALVSTLVQTGIALLPLFSTGARVESSAKLPSNSTASTAVPELAAVRGGGAVSPPVPGSSVAPVSPASASSQ